MLKSKDQLDVILENKKAKSYDILSAQMPAGK